MDKSEGRQRRAWPGVASTLPDKIYGPSGEILLDRSTDGPVVGRLTGVPGSSPDLHLRNPKGYAFVESKFGSYLCGNLSYDGVNWNRIDTSQPGVLFVISPSSILLYSTPAGANPAVLTSAGGFSPFNFAWAVLPASAHVYATVATVVPNLTVQPITFSTVITSTAGQPSSANPWNVASPTRMTAPVAGYYAFGGGIVWPTSIGGTIWGTFLLINSGAIKGGNFAPSNAAVAPRTSVAVTRYLNANDYIEVCGYHNAGAAASTVISGEECYMYMDFLHS
jgi:hypothetical protein